ncbi:MAG: hypothetical protein LBJ64_10900, partial [Deltaproteobacteria bacterium]|nr:hypothetical protein [Deltaproteobacteria bacterium]
MSSIRQGNFVVLDFETFYSNLYSLRLMSHEAYINDPRFQLMCCSVIDKLDGEWKSRVILIDSPYELERLQRFLHKLNTPDTWFVAHNMAFDGYILYRKLGIIPYRPLCTIALARWTGVSRYAGESLAKLSRHQGYEPKGSFLANMCGRWLS